MSMKSLSLDPSIHNTGYALLDWSKPRKDAWRWGTFQLSGMNLEMKMFDLVCQILDLGVEFDFLITEKPAFFSSERGQVAAHMNYTIDLAAISFYVAGWFKMDHRHHYAITANAWKGTVNKNITARKFFRLWPNVSRASLDEHAVDAIMLHRFWVEDYGIKVPKVLCDKSQLCLPELI